VQAKQFSGRAAYAACKLANGSAWMNTRRTRATSEQREFVVTGQTFRANNNLPGDLASSLRGLLGRTPRQLRSEQQPLPDHHHRPAPWHSAHPGLRPQHPGQADI
jgi:hypothetical protein